MRYFCLFLDGIAARRYNQETAFGQWLDVVIDLFTRGMLWCWSLPSVGFLIMGFEFLVFVCLHSPQEPSNLMDRGSHWQDCKKTELHWLAAKTVSKGFKTIPGTIAILGLWVLPIWVYILSHGVGSPLLEDILGFSEQGADSLRFLITAFLITSRCHCCFVECCILKNHVVALINRNT